MVWPVTADGGGGSCWTRWSHRRFARSTDAAGSGRRVRCAGQRADRQDRFRRGPWWASWALALLALGVYANSLGNSFHYDDSHAIVGNPSIRSLANLPRVLVDPQAFSREPQMAMYRPLLVASYSLNYALGGLNPVGFRLVNLGLHVSCVLLLFRVLAAVWAGTWARAWWGAALFAVHPVQSQVVNYISSRSESLAAVGVLVALLILWRPHPRLSAAVPTYAASLLAKSSAVALLPLLAATRWMPVPRRQPWRRQAWFWLATAAYLALTIANRFLTRSLAQDVRPYADQLLTQAKALVYYLWLAAMPVHLSVEHALEPSLPRWDWPVLASLALLLSLGALVWRLRRQVAWVWLGGAWLAAGLGLTVFVPLNVIVNEHRLYLALGGWAVLVIGGVGGGLGARRWSWFGAAALLCLGVLTWHRNTVWHDELTLWQDAAARAPRLFRAQSNLGLALYEAGQPAAAAAVLERALQLNPGYAKAWNNLGLTYEDLGRPAEALAAYRHALTADPELAGAWANIGRLQLAAGELPAARQALQKAVALDSWAPEPHVTLGLLEQREANPEAAVAQYRAALAADARSAEAWNNLGLALQESGRAQDALTALQQAVALRPGWEDARLNLAAAQSRAAGVPAADVYAQLTRQYPRRPELWEALASARRRQGDLPGAAAALAQAAQLDPGRADRFVRWGQALAAGGDPAAAAAAYNAGLAGAPDSAELLRGLATSLAALGQLDEAAAACRRLLVAAPDDRRAQQNLAQLEAARRARRH